MALSMVLLALNGAAAHVGSTPGLWQKARLAAVLAYHFAKEIVGFAAIIPSATRAFLIYSSLPSHPLSHLGLVDGTGKDGDTCNTAHRSLVGPKLRQRRWRAFKVSIARDIRYAEAKRNLLDVYVPQAEAVEGGRPVVMFVHGGIWASGSKEVFAHVGACLANHGVLAIVIQYTLFPEVLAWQQVREVSRALSWVLDNAVHYGGNPGRVTLMGHSAGAHLAALVLWERFKAGQQLQQRRAATTSQEAEIEWNEQDFDEEDVRQPCKFVGLAGVYDIVEHLKYEQKRGVASMSCMSPAMGGFPHLLEAMSPVRLFHSVVSSRRRRPSFYREFLFPSCTLLCSSSDTVVPPDTSLSFNAVLQQQLGLDSRLILLDSLRHGDFVVLDGSIPELVSLRNHILDMA